MNHGRAVRIVRSARDLTQKQLAEKADLDPSYISLLEAGKRIPSDETLSLLANALRVPKMLLIFLASEKDDLRGLSPEHAEAFGRDFLQILLDMEDSPGPIQGT